MLLNIFVETAIFSVLFLDESIYSNETFCNILHAFDPFNAFLLNKKKVVCVCVLEKKTQKGWHRTKPGLQTLFIFNIGLNALNASKFIKAHGNIFFDISF